MNTVSRIYSSVAAANAAIPLEKRYRTLAVPIDDGGGVKIYWWANSTADVGLVLFTPPAPSLMIFSYDEFTVSGNTSRPIAARTFVLAILIKPSVDLNDLDIGTSAAGTQIVEDGIFPYGTDFIPQPVNMFFESAGNIHFTGITASTEIKILKMLL